MAEAMRLCRESDVAILGDAPEIYAECRMKNNQLTFRYSERVYKEGMIKALYPRKFFGALNHHTKYCGKKLYMLCASAYAASDYALTGSYVGKTYKWGYFPDVKKHDIYELMDQKPKEHFSILWVGRLIGWKHPEVAVVAAERLKAKGYHFRLDIIGPGIMEETLNNMIYAKGLQDYVHLLGAMPPEKVRICMEKANIFLFTSDYNEGWGAVLNESMSSGCAVVASHAIGSVPFMIHHGENGLVYRNGDQGDMHQQLERLLTEPGLCVRLGIAAYQTVRNEWNADIAANRLIQLCSNLMCGEQKLPDNGPCSKARIIYQGKMYDSIMKMAVNGRS
jgi:glycosyltransferase involved in cell wall biosynthesis